MNSSFFGSDGIYHARKTANAARDRIMGYEPLLLPAAPGRVAVGGACPWLSVGDPGENSIAHFSSIESSSPNELVTDIGAHENSAGGLSAMSLVLVTVARYELAFVVVVVTVLVDWAGQGAALGCGATPFTATPAVEVDGVNSRAQSSPISSVSPRSFVTVMGGQLNSGISSSSSGDSVTVVVVVLATFDDFVIVDVTVVADSQLSVLLIV